MKTPCGAVIGSIVFDLRNHVILPQRVEQAERDAQVSVAQVKTKGGRAKVVKVKNETMPTPQGRRVIPRITSAMKGQAVKKVVARKGKAKAGESDGSGVVMKMEFGGGEDEELQEMGLAARLTKKAKKEPKEKGTR